MGHVKRLLGKLGPVFVLVLTVTAFSNSTATAARETGYVPVVVSSTGTTGTGGHWFHTRRISRKSRRVRTTVTPAKVIHGDDDIPGTPQYQLKANVFYPFNVRWHRILGDTEPITTWSPELYNGTGQFVTSDPTKIPIKMEQPDSDDYSYEEWGRVELTQDATYSIQPGAFVLLRATCTHTDGSNAKDEAFKHDSVRLYWLTPPPDTEIPVTGTSPFREAHRIHRPSKHVHRRHRIRHSRQKIRLKKG